MNKYTNDPLHEKKCLKFENGCVCTDSVYLFSESYTYLDNNKLACTNKAVWHSQKSSKERAKGLGNIPWRQRTRLRLSNSTLVVFGETDGNSFASYNPNNYTKVIFSDQNVIGKISVVDKHLSWLTALVQTRITYASGDVNSRFYFCSLVSVLVTAGVFVTD